MTAARTKVAVPLDEPARIYADEVARKTGKDVGEVLRDLVNAGIASKSTTRTHPHQCKPGDINPKYCPVCSRPMS